MELMQRYALHLIAACVLGLCRGEPDDVERGSNPQCICKPVMRLEWEPTSSICNNATYDWLMQTVLSQLSKQNDNLTLKEEHIDSLNKDIEEKDDVIYRLKSQIADLDYSVSDLQAQNTKLSADLQDARQHHAHLNPRPTDCADVQRYGFHYSGIYTIYPAGAMQGLEVFCDLNTDGGGWLVFQRRQDGAQSFDKQWQDYKHGFGKVAKEFWLGNDILHELSGQRQYEMRVDLTDFLGEKYYATYDLFIIDSETNKYTLHLGQYSGNAGDSLATHNHKPFSTTDQDNDESRSGNCSELYGRGGWWFARCYDSNLNGIYSNRHLYETVVWFRLRENHEPMRHAEMKIRPKNF